jgi:hypothetical protein
MFVAFLAIALFGARITSAGGAGSCDKPLSAMPGGDNVTAQGFADEDAALGRVIDLLYSGDRAGADNTFFGPVHSFTHNVDPVVRPSSSATAKQLCASVLKLESSLTAGSGASNIELAQQTAAVREALRDAAAGLGYPRPGGAQ